MKDRHAAIVLLGLAACAADEPDMPPTGDRPRDCAAELAAWDRINGTPPDGTDVVLDSAMLRDPVSADPRPLADGNPDTSERLTVDERVILRLDDSVFVGALRYTPIAGAPAITDFRVYLSFDRECWGDPVASGAFDGSDAAQEVLMNGRAANYIRIDILGATDGAAEVGVTDFAIVTKADIPSAPPEIAVVGVRWQYIARAFVPGPDVLLYEITDGPDGMIVDDDGRVLWTPAAGDEGDHEVSLEARRGETTVAQTFVVRVSGRRDVGRASVPAGGGSVVVSDPMGDVPDIEVTVDDSSAPASTVTVSAVTGEAPDRPSQLTALGVPFVIESDLPPGSTLSVRIPVAVPADSVFLTAYPQYGRFSGLGSLLRFSPWPIDRTPSAIAFRFRVEDAERAAVFQLNEGSSVVLEIDEFRIEYYLDAGQDPTGLETRLRAIADDLRASRDFMVALGCEFHARQDVHILDIGSDLGVVTEKSFLFELSKRHVDSDPETSVRATVAHEFTHVFQLIGLGGTWPDDLSEDFWIEGNAEYGADEVFDGNDYLIFDPYDEAVSSRGLRFHQNGMSYRRVTFWKSLKAQNGSFNVCEMIDAYVDNGRNGIAGLGALLGGDDARLEAYATFIAAWNHVRTENLLEDADVWFGDGDTPEFATRVGGRAVDGAQEYRWKENMHSTPGGESAILEVEDGGTMEIEVISPTDGYLLYVYDAEGERLAELNSGARTTRVDVTADVYLSLGVRQDGMVMWTNNLEIEVVARLECEDGDCGICAGDGAPCGGSGPSFDDGCCEGSICVVGACRPDDGARERGSCDTTEGCASGLVCKPVGSMEAARTCCARDTDYCESKADCCGFMDCTDNRCVGRTSGQECLSGDCVGVSFCDSGTCT